MEPSALRVLLVGDFPPPHGGVATHVAELHRAIRAQGGEGHVLDIGKGQLPADGVTPAGSPARFATLLFQYAARGYRVHVHTSGANPKSWALAAMCAAAGRASGVAPMVTFHSGLAPAWLAASATRRAVAKHVTAQFGTVLAVSDEIRAALAGCGVDPARIEVVHAFTPAFLRPGPPPVGFAELRAAASPLYCAMVAPRPEYASELLLQAFSSVREAVPSARLALYGIGSEAVRADGVHGFGELGRETALAVMAGSDVFVRATLADGDSVSVREALAFGRVVVASNVGNRPPAVRLVPVGDAAALARELIAVAREPAGRAAAPAEDCLERLLQLYGFEVTARSAGGSGADAPRAAASASGAGLGSGSEASLAAAISSTG